MAVQTDVTRCQSSLAQESGVKTNLISTNQGLVSRSRDPARPIRGQHSGHVIKEVKTNLISRGRVGARESAPIRLDTNTTNFCQLQGYLEAVTGFKVKLRSK